MEETEKNEEVYTTGISVVKLKTEFYSDDYDEEEESRCKNLNIPYERKMEPGYVYVNLSKMGSFNKSSKGNTVIYVDGINWGIEMKFEKFLELIGLEEIGEL